MDIYNIVENNTEFKDYIRLIQEHVKARPLTDSEYKTLTTTGSLRLQINDNINIQVSSQPGSYVGQKPYIVISHELRRAYLIDKDEFNSIFKTVQDSLS